MRNRSILISGLGIAGPTLALRLREQGFAPEIVEAAPAPRTGGYIIDIWGIGFAAVERLGLLPALRDVRYRFAEVVCVDRRGRRVAGIGADAFRETLGDRYFSIMRGDLADVLYRRIADVPVRFGDTLTAIAQDEDGVTVRFERSDPRRYDLVIGADGLRSAVRAAAFGSDAAAEVRLGSWVASFTCIDYPHCDPGAYVSYTRPHRQLARYALRDGRTAFLMVWTAEDADASLPNGIERQRAAICRAFAESGWEWPEIRRRLEMADDLYFDSVSQVRAATWSSGRVALVGDAAYCPSLLAGEGAALAMAGAEVLAAELARADGDHGIAFARYEARLRDQVERTQRGALWYANQFAPRSTLALWWRNQSMKLLNLPFVGPILAKRLLGTDFRFSDSDAPGASPGVR